MRAFITTNLFSSHAIYAVLLTTLLVLPVQGFTCTAANATPSDPNGADPNQIAETGCRIFNSCTSSKQRRATLSRRQVGASAITCPDTYGCYVLTTNGGLFCLDLNSFDYITGDGVCGNMMVGSTYVCGSSGGAGGDTGTGSGSGADSGSGSGNSGGSGSGSGSGSGNGGGGDNGNGNGSEGSNANGDGNGAGKPNGAARAVGDDKIANSFVALVVFFAMLQVI